MPSAVAALVAAVAGVAAYTLPLDKLVAFDFSDKADSLMIAAGFGIAAKDQIDSLAGHADCAIIGSEITRRIGRAFEEKKDAAAEIAAFMKTLREAQCCRFLKRK